jgi:hypothetical protein
MATQSSRGKTVSFLIDVWYNQETGAIQLATNDKDAALSDFNVAVTGDATKRNGHPTLFNRLKKLLEAHGAPAPS